MRTDKKKNNSLILIISLLLILGPTLYFGIVGKAAEMGVALAAGTLSAAFLHLDKLQKFKGAGIEIELKEAVKEAQATLETLKDYTDPVYISSIKIMSEGLTWEGISEDTQHDIVRKIEKIVNNNGASEDVSEAIKEFYNFNLTQLFDRLIPIVDGYFKPEATKNLLLLRDRENFIFPSEKQVRQALEALPHLTPDLEESIKDYGYYKENLYPRNHS
ncbi:hypothetical protein [Paenibacillus solani]|uniref:hypothetical protein n=1 Tax=Paenibacillus solani TaxID=1705565 RepID=UPI003D2B0ACD